jgi:hypothetical protein
MASPDRVTAHTIEPSSQREDTMPAQTETRTFHAPMADVMTAATDALRSLGADIEDGSDGTTVSGKTGWSMFSFFGERVRIDLEQVDDDVRVTVTSRQSRGQFLDLSRRNQKNVGTVLNAMAMRLGSQ